MSVRNEPCTEYEKELLHTKKMKMEKKLASRLNLHVKVRNNRLLPICKFTADLIDRSTMVYLENSTPAEER